MLKKRIRKWDLDKKHKEPDMLVALQMALARESLGKKTTFVIRNREVTLEEIEHYFKRKGVRDLRALLTGPRVCTSTTSLYYYTPPPSPGAEPTSPSPNWEDFEDMDLDIGELSEDGGVYRFVIHRPSEQSIPSPTQRLYSSLPLPEGQGRLESLLMFTRACNELGVPSRGMTRSLHALNHYSLAGDIVEGCALQRLGRIHEAFVFFNKAFDLAHKTLKIDLCPFLLLDMYGLTDTLDKGHTEILYRLFDFVVQLSGVYVERVRPLKQAMTVLIQIPSNERADSAARGLDYMCENAAGAAFFSRYYDISCWRHLYFGRRKVKILGRRVYLGSYLTMWKRRSKFWLKAKGV